MTKTIIALLAAGALLVGCDSGKGGGDGKGEGKAGASGDSIGVAECDEYVKKWEACFKDPTMRAAAEPAFKAQRDAFKTAAAQGGAAKDALKNTCKQALDQLATNPACK